MTRLLASQLRVSKDTQVLSLTLSGYIDHFQRRHRATIGQRMENMVDGLHRHILMAYAFPHEKQKYLMAFIVDFESLKILIWKSARKRQLSLRQEAHLAELMDGIGRQITAWKNAPVKTQV